MEFIIHKKKVLPGNNAQIQIPVGQLPSGTPIDIQTFVFRSKEPGPVMLVLGGVHGDEVNGVEIVRRTLSYGYFKNLIKGTVIAIPLLNIYGFINFSREVPDGKDINRSFPGTTSGSLAARVARVLTKKILPLVDFVVDFHTGGANRHNYPQIRYARLDPSSKLLAEAFSAPYTIASGLITNSLRKVALDAFKIPVIIFEGGEATRFDGVSIENGLAGLKRLMAAKGMIDETPHANSTIHIAKTSWIRAPKAGIFLWSKKSGNKVKIGEPIGFINDPYGQKTVTIISKRNGYIIGHNNAPVVNMGDALFNIGYNPE